MVPSRRYESGNDSAVFASTTRLDPYGPSTKARLLDRLSSIRWIVFDLDGTLYPDAEHFDIYLREVTHFLPSAQVSSFLEDYNDLIHGRLPLRFGRIYDVQADAILSLNNERYVRHAWDWRGNPLSGDLQKLYPFPIVPDQRHMIMMGDLWYAPYILALRYGLRHQTIQQAFLNTRAHMDRPEYRISPVPGMNDTLQDLREAGIRLALVSNSERRAGWLILNKLQLGDKFDEIIFEANKPVYAADHLLRLQRIFRLPFHMGMSVGDNFPNEVLPAQELGMLGLLIDPYGYCNCDEDGWDIRVMTQAESVSWLRAIGHATGDPDMGHVDPSSSS